MIYPVFMSVATNTNGYSSTLGLHTVDFNRSYTLT